MKRVTIEDVAQAAGVSRQTVSRAMNDKGEISPETKERVMRAIDELGYRPNRLAQGMVTNRTRTIGLVMPDITNLFFPEVARGLQDSARDYGYNVILCNTDDDGREEINALRSLAAQGVDGIALISSSADAEELRHFAEAYSPIVILNRFFEHPHVSLIIVDNERGGYLATEHLILKGHEAVGMLAADAYRHSRIRRVQGYERALKAYGRAFDDRLIVGASPTLVGGYAGLQELVKQSNDVTAVFAYNDLMAIGAIRACRDLGLLVPQDMAIIGFDDIALAAMYSPSLSSIRVDKYDIGLRATERLLAMLDEPAARNDPIYVGVDLVVRESTAG